MIPDSIGAPRRARLLLVDDQPPNLTALKAILEPLEQELVLASSGLEALKCVLTDDFALILLDVQMPGMDGFETATLIRQREKSRYIPIIFVTANGNDPSFLEQAYAAGAVDYLQKPYNYQILQSKVAVFVDLFLQHEKIKEQATLLSDGLKRELLLEHTIREQKREQEHLRELTRREAEKAALAHEIEQMAVRQRLFLREVLSSLTEGRLHLCDTAADLPDSLPPLSEPIPLTVPTLRVLRRFIVDQMQKAEWPAERAHDLETAVGEAAMNAVVHGKNATGQVCASEGDAVVQVWLRDTGAGISEDALHRATLERGFSSAGTLGHGFWMMLKTADRVHLLTSAKGTTVVIEQERDPPMPPWMQSAPAAYDLSAVPVRADQLGGKESRP
ncbi:MAG: response regulator [Fibrella sp.]|nr:response regulator [Armatimonadota bacterium]